MPFVICWQPATRLGGPRKGAPIEICDQCSNQIQDSNRAIYVFDEPLDSTETRLLGFVLLHLECFDPYKAANPGNWNSVLPEMHVSAL